MTILEDLNKIDVNTWSFHAWIIAQILLFGKFDYHGYKKQLLINVLINLNPLYQSATEIGVWASFLHILRMVK